MLTTSFFPNVYSSHRLPRAGAAPPRSQRLRHQGLEPAVRITEPPVTPHGTEPARTPVGAHACVVSAHGPGPPRSSRRREARHPWRWLQGKPHWSPYRRRHLRRGRPRQLSPPSPSTSSDPTAGSPGTRGGRRARTVRSRSSVRRPPSSLSTPTQARSRPASPTPRPHGALSARWGGATLGRGVATVLDARTRSQPLGYVSGHVTPTRESPVKQQDVKKKFFFF